MATTKTERKRLRRLFSQEVDSLFEGDCVEQIVNEQVSQIMADRQDAPSYTGAVVSGRFKDGLLYLDLGLYFAYPSLLAERGRSDRIDRIPIPESELEIASYARQIVADLVGVAVSKLCRKVPSLSDIGRIDKNVFRNTFAVSRDCPPSALIGDVTGWFKAAASVASERYGAEFVKLVRESMTVRAKPFLEKFGPYGGAGAPYVISFSLNTLPQLTSLELSVRFRDKWGHETEKTVRTFKLEALDCLWMAPEKAMASLLGVMRAFLMESIPDILADLPPLLRRLRTDGWAYAAIKGCESGYPCISADFSSWFTFEHDLFIIISPLANGNFQESLATSGPLSVQNSFVLGEWQTPPRGDEVPQSPAECSSLAGITAFFRNFCAQYAQADGLGLPHLPHLRFFFCGSSEVEVQYREVRLGVWTRFNFGEKPLSAYSVETLVTAVIEQAEAEYIRQSELVDDLSELNEAELQIVKLLKESASGLTVSDIRVALSGKTAATPKGISQYLRNLNMFGFAGGYDIVLSDSRYDFFNSYYVYSVHDQIPIEAIMAATPRPFGWDDLQFLKASAREPVVAHMLTEAATREERWHALKALETTSKKFLVQFAKSEAGVEFFSKLEGDDALYAGLLVSGLPGCKRIAEQYLSGNKER